MNIKNVQERVFVASADELAALVADFGMWPTEIVAAPQSLGGRRYRAGMMVWEEYERPGAIRAFRIVGPDGLRGEHWFEVERVDEGARLRHAIAVEAVGDFEKIWQEQIEPLHARVFDALFDNVEVALGALVERRGRRHGFSDRQPVAEDVELVLETFEAVEKRDERRLRELYHPDLEFHWPASLPYGGSFRANNRTAGQGWLEIWDQLQPTKAERRMDPRVVAASKQEVVVLWRQRGISPSGERFDGEVLGLYAVRDGKFARAQMFYFDTAAVVRFLDNANATEPRADD